MAGADRQGAGTARPPRSLATVRTYYLLIAVVGTLVALGVVMVLSASSVSAFAAYGDSYKFFKRQVGWVLLGLAVMGAVSRVDYRRWRRLGAPLLALSVLGLVFVLAHPSSISAYGATRWIPLPGGQQVQPAEFAKLALLLFGADVLTRKAPLLGDVRHLLVPVVPVTLVLAVLIMAEPDLGTTMLLVAISFGLLFLADAPLALLAGVGAVGLAGGLGLAMSAGYRRARLLSFLHPERDPLYKGYQLIQGRLALGSGGWLGVGLGQSRQKWSFVPNAHTDFIFAIIGEELGLVGTLSVVALFVMLAYVGVRVARRASDPFGRYLAGGITIWITVQALVNMGAVVGVLPITGVPLPLVSFGGSSMVVLLAAVGILLNVARQDTARRAVAGWPAGVARRRGPAAGAGWAHRSGHGAGRGPVVSANRHRLRSGPYGPSGQESARPTSVRLTSARLTPARKARADADRGALRAAGAALGAAPEPTEHPTQGRARPADEDGR